MLDAASEVRDCPAPTNPTTRATGYLALHNVGFSYEPGRPVLRGITAEIAAGSTVAVMGPSGAGKRTLLSLVMRFYDPVSGFLTLDGHDLRTLALKYLRRSMALVSPEPLLFASSVRDNIAYGRPSATNEQVRAAAVAARASDFIEALPQRYDTYIGERGANLSRGQRQRLSIARAFLQDASILVMEEPSSTLDPETEAALLCPLERLKRGRTTIIIAHRPSTIRSADKILVLDQGRIVAAGSHERLLRQNGVYARSHAAQFHTASKLNGGTAHVT